MAMDAYKTRSDFAEMQIRCLLRDLDQKSHKDRLRAAKKFQEYIDTYKPEVRRRIPIYAYVYITTYRVYVWFALTCWACIAWFMYLS